MGCNYSLMVSRLLFNISNSIYTQLNDYTYSKWLISSIWLIEGTLIGTTFLYQSEPGNDNNERVLRIP